MTKSKQNNSIEQQQKESQQVKEMEKQRGYGDKKLEGPNIPAE